MHHAWGSYNYKIADKERGISPYICEGARVEPVAATKCSFLLHSKA